MSLYLAFRTGATLIRPSLNAMVDLSSVSARSALHEIPRRVCTEIT